MTVDVPVALIDAAVCMAKAWNDEHPSGYRSASGFLAHAWMLQVCAESEGRQEDRPAEVSRRMDIAKRLAGEYANDVVMGLIDQQPMYHRVGLIDKNVVAIGVMLMGCVPLWVHYYRAIMTFESAICEQSA